MRALLSAEMHELQAHATRRWSLAAPARSAKTGRRGRRKTTTFQDMRNVGVHWEQLGPLFHSAADYVATWKKAVAIGSAHQ